jgi:radical SAM superfamily enzyme YgiQ (UPF0313 family)
MPEEAAAHADTIFRGPGEDTWPAFLADLRAGRPRPRYASRVRTLDRLPPIRRDLIKRPLYLVPNSIVVSRGCPHHCDFCYKDAFFAGGRSFYVQAVDDALAEIDEDGPDVFDRTVEWAIEQGVETATFHILTPYPGTALHDRMTAEDRILHRDWDRYDTRHVVYRPRRLSTTALEEGYWRAYRNFYRWSAIWRGASTKDTIRGRLRHIGYAGGWKKFEPAWGMLIRAGQVLRALPLLETVLSGRVHDRARTEALPAATGVVSAPGSVTVTSSPPPSSATALTDPP